MKSVVLLRHAKSSWDEPALSDHERPLAPRGEDAAPRMGAWIGTAGLTPDHVICSSATRARQTWELAAGQLSGEPSVAVTDAIYAADAAQVLTALRGAPDTAGRVMVVGHNPALENLAAALIHDGDPDAMTRMAHKFPTAALAEIELPIATWRDLANGLGRLTRFVRPKDLAAG